VYTYIVRTPASIPFFPFFHSLYPRLVHSSFIASFFRLFCSILILLFLISSYIPKHPIFRAIRISRLLLSFHFERCSVQSGVFTYFTSLSLSLYLSLYTYIFQSLSPPFCLSLPGAYTRRRVFTRYKRKLFNLQHSADFEDKQLEIGKRNKNSTIRQQ